MRSQVRSGARLRRIAITVAVVVVGLIVVGRITGVLVDWLWFSSIGYVDVFWTVLSAQALLFVVVFAVSAGAIWVSGLVAHRYARTLRPSQASAAFSFGPSTAISELADRVAQLEAQVASLRRMLKRLKAEVAAGGETEAA